MSEEKLQDIAPTREDSSNGSERTRITIVAPIGYTKTYRTVRYVLGDRSEEDWLSLIALLKLLNVTDSSSDVAIILLYPDNDGAKTSIYKGWEDASRPSVLSRLQEEFQIPTDHIKHVVMTDGATLKEEDLWSSLNELHLAIKETLKEGPTKLIFDLTHSHRHLSFSAFIESAFLSQVSGNITDIEVYHAIARQPLKDGDEVSYSHLNSFVDKMGQIGRLKNVISKFRPEDLNQIIEELEKDELPGGLRKWLDNLVSVLFKLQVGVISDEVLGEIHTLLTENVLNDDNSQHVRWQFMVDAIKEQLRELGRHLGVQQNDKSYHDRQDRHLGVQQNDKSYHDRQVALADYILTQQGNILLAYLYMRESLVSAFVDVLKAAEIVEATVPGGNKEERGTAEQILHCLAREARKSRKNGDDQQEGKDDSTLQMLIDFANFTINNIGNKRNTLAHVGSGRKQTFPQKKSKNVLVSQWKMAKKDLKKLKEKITRLMKSKASAVKSLKSDFPCVKEIL